MKVISYFLVAVLLLGACKNTKSNNETESVSTDEQTLIQTLKEQLIASDNPLERIKINVQIADLQFKNASEEDRPKLYYDMTTFNWVELDRINEKESEYLESYYSYRFNDEGESREPHDSIKQKEKPYLEAGLVFKELGEGLVEIDFPEDFYSKYEKQLSEDYQEYLRLERDATNIAPDAILILAWEDIADLIVRYEAYAEKYPQNIGLFKMLAGNYEFLQQTFVTGTDNTLIVDENGQLLSELKTEWLRFSKAYPKSPTTKLIQIALAEKQYAEPHIYTLIEKINKAQSASDDPYMSNKQ
ncbi:hypothetical protein [Capnocytophaga canimorsus]|uniref:hypothetical protein n=1 Tax=Capnocytophaga canimorsus TaxID=28188 RepID=UPI001AD40822|nr:hypothetical protein [Capnocytophaga canimorsus]GIM57947.1 hypothetical protein CAPN007_01550 [Capnocytophaga canimorsus]